MGRGSKRQGDKGSENERETPGDVPAGFPLKIIAFVGTDDDDDDDDDDTNKKDESSPDAPPAPSDGDAAKTEERREEHPPHPEGDADSDDAETVPDPQPVEIPAQRDLPGDRESDDPPTRENVTAVHEDVPTRVFERSERAEKDEGSKQLPSLGRDDARPPSDELPTLEYAGMDLVDSDEWPTKVAIESPSKKKGSAQGSAQDNRDAPPSSEKEEFQEESGRRAPVEESGQVPSQEEGKGVTTPHRWGRGKPAATPAPTIEAPAFEPVVNTLVFDNAEGRHQYIEALAERLRTAVTSAGSAANSESDAPARAHQELDPRPFEQSLVRNPDDRAAARALHRIYTAHGRWNDVVTLLVDRAERAADSSKRADLLVEAATLLHDRLGQPDQALIALIQAVVVDPTHDESANRLFRLAEAHEAWTVLFSDIGHAAVTEQEPQRRSALCSRLGDWYLYLGHTNHARTCYDQALRSDPDGVRALSGLALVVLHENQKAGLSHIISRLPRAPKAGIPAEVGLRIARVYAALGENDKAVPFLEHVLDARPDSASALTLWEHVCRQLGLWERLVQRLRVGAQRSSEKGKPPEFTSDLWRRAASVLANEAQDVDGLETACRRVLQLTGPDEHVLDIMAGYYARRAQWNEVAQAFEQNLLLTKDVHTRAELMLRLARVHMEELDEPGEALRYLHEVEALEGDNHQAPRYREDILRRLGRWSELADELEARGQRETDPGAVPGHLIRAAQVRIDHLDQHDQGAALLRRARALAPHDERIVAKLAETLSATGHIEEALTYLEEHAQLPIDRRARASSLVEASRLAWRRLSDAPRATDLAKRAVELDPNWSQGHLALAELKQGEGDQQAALQAYEDVLDAVEGEEKGRVHIALAEFCAKELGRPDRAMHWYEEAREHLGPRPDVVLPLLDLHLGREDFAEAHRLAREVTFSRDPNEPTRVAFQAMRCADACLRVGDDVGAVAHLETVVKAMPGHAEALGLLADAYEEQKRWGDARRTVSALRASGGPTKRPVELRLARVSRLAGRLGEARQIVESLLKEAPRDPSALRELADIEDEAGNTSAALAAWTHAGLSKQKDGVEKCRRFLDVAREEGKTGPIIQALATLCAGTPDDAALLTSLAEHYERAEAWGEAIQTWQRLFDFPGEIPVDRVDLAFRAANLCSDRERDSQGAAEWFRRALSSGWPGTERAAAVQAFLDKLDEGPVAAELYGLLFARAVTTAEPKVVLSLARPAAAAYQRAKQPEKAASVLAEALRLDRFNTKLQLELVALHEQAGEYDRALDHCRELAQQDHWNADLRQTVFRLRQKAGQKDGAYYVAAALVARGEAPAEAREVYERGLQQGWTEPQSSLQRDDWHRALRHHDEAVVISEIFEAARPILPVLPQGPQPPDPGDGLIITSNDPTYGLVAQMVANLSRTLGVRDIPNVRLDDSVPVLVSRPTEPLELGMNPSFASLPRNEQALLAARCLAYHQGGRFGAVIFPSVDDAAVVIAAIIASVTGNEERLPGAARTLVDLLCEELKGNPAVLSTLTRLIGPLLSQGGTADLETWRRGCERTARRAAALMVPEPTTLATALARLPEDPATPPGLDECLDFFASWEYLQLRRSLGIAFETNAKS